MRSRRHRNKHNDKNDDDGLRLLEKTTVLCEGKGDKCATKNVLVKTEPSDAIEEIPFSSKLKRTFTFIKETPEEALITGNTLNNSPKVPKKTFFEDKTNHNDLSSNRKLLLAGSKTVHAVETIEIVDKPLLTSTQNEENECEVTQLLSSQSSNEEPQVKINPSKKPILRRLNAIKPLIEAQVDDLLQPVKSPLQRGYTAGSPIRRATAGASPITRSQTDGSSIQRAKYAKPPLQSPSSLRKSKAVASPLCKAEPAELPLEREIAGTSPITRSQADESSLQRATILNSPSSMRKTKADSFIQPPKTVVSPLCIVGLAESSLKRGKTSESSLKKSLPSDSAELSSQRTTRSKRESLEIEKINGVSQTDQEQQTSTKKSSGSSKSKQSTVVDSSYPAQPSSQNSNIQNFCQSSLKTASKQSLTIESDMHKELLNLWNQQKLDNIRTLIEKTFKYRRHCIKSHSISFLEIFSQFPYLTNVDIVIANYFVIIVVLLPRKIQILLKRTCWLFCESYGNLL